jgi:carbon-monoxide dehydrogenase medium subunit
VLNIKRIPVLNDMHFSPESGLSLGPLVTIRALERSGLIRANYPALSQAASSFAGVQIRNLATIGGNVCNASPSGDTLPALLAYGAECRLMGPHGERVVDLETFFQGPGQTVLQPGELLVELRLPPPLPHTGALYIKHSPRTSMDIAAVGAVSVVSLIDGDVCQQARIALGAVAPTVVRAMAAETLLQGNPLSPDRIAQAAQAAAHVTTPIDDIRATAAHRKAVTAPLVARTLTIAKQMAQGESFSFATQRGLAVETVF